MINALVVFISLLGLIFIQASSDAISRKNRKKFWGWSKHLVTLLAIPAASVASIKLGYDIKDIVFYSFAYILLRAGFYNPVYNMVYGYGADKSQPWYYFGTTKIWDKFNRWLMEKSPFKPPMWSLQATYITFSIPIALTFTGFWNAIENARNMI